LARSKFKGPFGLIRELLKYADHIESIHLYRKTGILKMVLAGHVIMPMEIIEAMKKSGYILKIFYNSLDPEFIDSDILGDYLNGIKDEDDVPAFVCTNLLFKDTEPPLENGGKSDLQALITEPLRAEFEAMRRDTACSNCEVKTEGEDEDE
jgi:hypothetical protein